VVDVTVVQRKLSQLDTYLQQVSEFSTITLEEYQGEWKIQRIVERTLQMMIETCVDIANHLISDRGMRSPTSYADTFQILKENAIVNDSLHDSLEKMVKFRNIVVHQYEGVDAGIVLMILKNHLEDFERFRDAVIAHLGNGLA
jgi:uncharacterized protein YutE (UPF0331/DUF86 family)